MSNINVFNSSGIKISEITTPFNSIYVGGRISKGIGKDTYYYKGVGSLYNFHYVFSVKKNKDKVIRKINNPLVRYQIERQNFKGKFGIFEEPYNPLFTEYIGSCGLREHLIVEHSLHFPLSGVQVVDYVPYCTYKNQGYYIVFYKDERKSYLGGNSNPKNLFDLLIVMLNEDWNFPWDKDSISDITNTGHVSDVADLYRGYSVEGKLGTVYSILHSLAIRDVSKYIEFIEYIDLSIGYSFNLPKVAAAFINKYFKRGLVECNTNNICSKLIVESRNCAHGEFTSLGDLEKEVYLDNWRKQERIVRDI